MRYAILRNLADLHEVASGWPLVGVERVALWVVPAESQAAAERFAEERFYATPHVVLSLEEAESQVRQELLNLRRGRAA